MTIAAPHELGAPIFMSPAVAALAAALMDESILIEARLGLDRANATIVSPAAVAALVPAARELLAGRPINMFVVGGSAAAGAGGIGVNHTFDARLANKLNQLIMRVEAARGAPAPAITHGLGRVNRMSLAQGGTTSFWAGLMSEGLYGAAPVHLLLSEYAINDRAC